MNKKRPLNKELFIICLFIIIFIIMIAFILPKEIYVTSLKSYRRVGMRKDFIFDKVDACYGNKFFNELSHCFDISDKVKITGEVNNQKEGQYVLIYTVNYRGIEKVMNQTVEVVFDLEPEIDLKGNYYVTRCPNGNYYHPEFSITDDKDGDLTNKVEYSDNDNIMSYIVTDSSGGKSVANRNINLVDSIYPEFNIKGNQTININLGENFVDPGYSAFDNCDGDISNKVSVVSDLDINKEGIYLLQYSVADSTNNKKNLIRKVVVGNPVLPNKGKEIYLTYDDGPNSNTQNLLSVLEKYNVKATFFVTGQFPKYFNVIKDIKADGHVVALHTYSHRFDIIYDNPDSFFADINKLNEVIFEYTGEKTNLLRFAGGSSNQMTNKNKMKEIIRLTKENGYVYFDWNVDSNDTKYTNFEEVAASTINQLKVKKPFYIVLQHDSKSQTANATEKIIRFGLKNGYEFKKLSADGPTIQHR